MVAEAEEVRRRQQRRRKFMEGERDRRENRWRESDPPLARAGSAEDDYGRGGHQPGLGLGPAAAAAACRQRHGRGRGIRAVAVPWGEEPFDGGERGGGGGSKRRRPPLAGRERRINHNRNIDNNVGYEFREWPLWPRERPRRGQE